MAFAFWNSTSEEQAAFFTALSQVIRADYKCDPSLYGLGELQWFYLADDLQAFELEPARQMLMAMAAPLYLNTLRFAEGPSNATR